jgi:hypothetical protein
MKTILDSQLRRMRAMNWKYHALFFRQINFWIAVNVGLLVVSLAAPFRAGVLLVPYLVLYAAMQGAFHFHYIIFARRYARALEQKINRLNGNHALIAYKLEDAYYFPLDAPRFVGVSVGNLFSFFSAITFHYGIAGAVLWALALYRSALIAPQLSASFAPLTWYVPVTIAWTMANMIYLAWFFVGQRDERGLESELQIFMAEGIE